MSAMQSLDLPCSPYISYHEKHFERRKIIHMLIGSGVKRSSF